ncbi:type II CAAX prenyl endopeptidase Rce1 family protein [Chryseobacterium sp. JV274]
MCYTFFLAIITSLIYLKERNYLYPIIFHLIYNFIVLCVY